MSYILQKDCDTCVFITLANAFINKCGKSPMPEYYSEEWFEFTNRCRRSYNKTWMRENHYHERLQRMFCVKYRSLESTSCTELKKKVVEELNNGNVVDFSICHHGLHSMLITEYDAYRKSFCCINAKIYTDKTPVEWLPFEILVNSTKIVLLKSRYMTPKYSLANKNTHFNIANRSHVIEFDKSIIYP